MRRRHSWLVRLAMGAVVAGSIGACSGVAEDRSSVGSTTAISSPAPSTTQVTVDPPPPAGPSALPVVVTDNDEITIRYSDVERTVCFRLFEWTVNGWQLAPFTGSDNNLGGQLVFVEVPDPLAIDCEALARIGPATGRIPEELEDTYLRICEAPPGGVCTKEFRVG